MDAGRRGSVKLPDGVEIHGKSLRIWFMYQGKRYRERITQTITKGNITYCARKRATILVEIAENRFDYAAHFPNSPHIAKAKGLNTAPRTVREAVESWLSVQEAKKAKSTYRNYASKSKHVVNKWGDALIAKIPKSEIEMFQTDLLKSGLSAKTVNDIFTIVRGIWHNAYCDELMSSNPLERITNVEFDADESADPFNKEELAAIEKMKTHREGERNMVLFNCWTGLSTSELIGLAWEDIDMTNPEHWRLNIKRARVESFYKVPKEKSRARQVELLGQAMPWIRRQYAETYMLEAKPVEVMQRDNNSTRTESLRFVFLNSVSGEPWHNSSLHRWFSSMLRKAKVRHRGPNQCKHTFASQALSHYVPLEWVARALGHADTNMIKRHYGRWIPTDAPSMAGLVTQMINGEFQAGAKMGQNELQRTS
ncbi:Arm DNA-binding domain-containing protein [Allohahella sp. A8]|uniref:Arm DNA-binding domain-containing protein n=1 Tax=Allohahella sp. A8 TaxID=3141461 RepID=UPI003A803C55